MKPTPVALGVAGLGLAGLMVLDGVAADPEVAVVAGADPSADARAGFETRTAATAYATVEQLCADPLVDAVWVATPTRMHHEHVLTAISAGKHVIVDKPMAASVAECEDMVAAATRAGVVLLAGGSRGLDPLFRTAGELVTAGLIGQVEHLWLASFTGWLRRPRTAQELDPTVGGGILFNQAPHQIDAVRVVAGGRRVLAVDGRLEERADGSPPGRFHADLELTDGVTATVGYDGHGGLRAVDAFPDAGSAATLADAGMLVATGSRGVVRGRPDGVEIVTDDGEHLVPIPPGDATGAAIRELVAALETGETPIHTGLWGRDTVAVVTAWMASARDRRPVRVA